MNIFLYIFFYFFSKIWNRFTPRRGTVSGLTNSSLVACYQDTQMTCNILNSNSLKRTKPKYSINPAYKTAKNLNNDAVDLWSLGSGYVRFENEENSTYPQESREWKTVTTYSSKHKISCIYL
jgi:hypothetical protein